MADIRGKSRTAGSGGGWNTPGAFAPADIAESPAAGGLTLTGFAPTTSQVGPQIVTDSVPAGQLTLVGFAPTDSQVGIQTITDSVSPGTLLLTGFAPATRTPGIARPDPGILQLTGLAPTARRLTDMALDTYSNITAALITQTHHDDLTAVIDDLFLQGEHRIYRRLRLRTMETFLSTTLSTAGAPVPADYVEMIHVHTLRNNKAMDLEWRPPEWIYRTYTARNGESRPRYIAREGENFIFGPSPSADDVLNGYYYKRLQSLNSTSTNWFTSNAPDLLMAAAKVEIYNFKEDYESAGIWEDKFNLIAARVEKEEKKEHRGGGQIRPHTDYRTY